MNKIDSKLQDVLGKYHDDPRSAVWNCHGTWVAYHKDLELIAAKANISFDPPQVLEADGPNKCAALCVIGRLAERTEWSIGEAAPSNNKNSYPFAMAEKRAKDRVILKLIGLHGMLYSEEEADDFKASKPKQQEPVFSVDLAMDKIKSSKDLEVLKRFWQVNSQFMKTEFSSADFNALEKAKDERKAILLDVEAARNAA